ncbi:hypothetical protein [Haloflavibacter putidus]|uniref:Uncharacterized protein n=1 Tax=Haloflavibacter putidus TaxID=2576776 RepID=A0A507ZM80_9FLAO|nr:hypothetical protein [Haloflavibacter putidus]TQD34822.1 hypothetical protein FKR84_11550 [Haloflavibacter putidus]
MKNIKILLFAFVASIFASSCLVDDDVAREFDESPAVVGFKNDLAAENYFSDEGAVLTNYPVVLLGNGGDGTYPTEDIVIAYEIDASSTATEGQEFDFTSNSGTLTIEAGSGFANFGIDINTGNLDPNVPTELILNLTEVIQGEAVISSVNNTLAITFVGCQSDVNEYTYNVTTTRLSDGALMGSDEENIMEIGVNNFKTESTGPYGVGNYAGGDIGGGDNGFTFIDICGQITVSSQNLVGAYSNQVFGAGSVDPETGVITITYTITYSSGDSVFESVYEPIN